jgi:hypothetical protein
VTGASSAASASFNPNSEIQSAEAASGAPFNQPTNAQLLAI